MGYKTLAASRQDGLDAEAQVIDWLLDFGYDVEIPSIAVNKKYDIDALLFPSDRMEDSLDNVMTVSIKANTPEYFESPFLFELEQGWVLKEGKEHEPIRGMYRTLEEFDDNGKVINIHRVKTWYYTGRASKYIIYKRNTPTTGVLFMIDRLALHNFVDHYGFDTITESKGAAKSRERKEGKVFTKLGLIDQQRLIQNGIAERIGSIHDKENYNDEF